MENITITVTAEELDRIKDALAISSFDWKDKYYKEALKDDSDRDKLETYYKLQKEYVELFNKIKNLKTC